MLKIETLEVDKKELIEKNKFLLEFGKKKFFDLEEKIGYLQNKLLVIMRLI